MSTLAAPTLPRHLRTIAADIKIAHSVFALPFAVLGAFLAAAPERSSWITFSRQLLLIVLAMVLARTVAMLANRLLDRHIDARNPRTAGRALPSGRLTPRAAKTVLGLCAAIFMVVCLAFGWLDGNWWPASLGVPVLAWLGLYPLLKRVSSWCHLYLGSCLAISPLAAALAVDPGALLEQPALWLLAGMVLCWVAGFDVIYALQDLEVDRAQGLHSIPGRLGAAGALWVSRGLHALAAACLLAAALDDTRLGVLFGVGVGIVLALLLLEHATVARWGTKRLALAFFTLNGLISCVLGALGSIDILLS